MTAVSSLQCLLLLGLLHFSVVKGFSVKVSTISPSGYEGNDFNIGVSLDGQIFGAVDVELKLLTVSEFEGRNIGPLPVAASGKNPAEHADFEFNQGSTHTFHNTSDLHQSAQFSVHLEDDVINELVEVFIILVEVTAIANPLDIVEPSTRPFTLATIQVDSNDKTQLSIGAQTVYTVPESSLEWSVSLTIVRSPPEHDIEIAINTQGISSNPAAAASDYILRESSVTLTPTATEYNVTMEIVDNDIPEPEMEAVGLTFVVTSGGDMVTFTPSTITITIVDDDVLTFGFTETMLEIREGESGEAIVAILSPALVDVSVSMSVQLLSQGTAQPNEMSFPRGQFVLSGGNMQQLISISIADDDVQTANDREFTLIVASTVDSHLRVINPMVLTVNITDNDTEVIYGIREVNPLTPMTVQEGEDITITVGLLGPDSPNLDYDFVVGYTVKILYGGVHGNATDADFEGTEIASGTLTDSMRSRDITIMTKSNDKLEENRDFTIIVEQTTDNSPLVKLQSATASVVILDDDIDIPNKPNANVTVYAINQERFEIKWDIEITTKQPVTSYRIFIRVSNDIESSTGGVNITRTISDPTALSTTEPYKINGVDYSVIYVRVCAVNDAGETCSKEAVHKRPEKTGTSPREDSELPGRVIAAIVVIIIIVVLLLCCLLVILVVCLLKKGIWSNYSPIFRDKKTGTPSIENGSKDDVQLQIKT